MNLLNALANLGKGAANATGLPYLINTTVVNPIKSLTAQATGNRQAYLNAEKAYQQPIGTQLKQWGGNSAAALLPFVGGAGIAKVAQKVQPTNLLQKSLLSASQGGLIGGAMNTAGTMGTGANPTLKDFGKGALFGGVIGGAAPLANALWLANKGNLPQRPPTITTNPTNTNPHLYQAKQHLNQIERRLKQENLSTNTFRQLAKAREDAVRDIIHINETGLPMAVKPKGGVYGAAKQAQLSKQDANAQFTRELITNYLDNRPTVQGSALSGEGSKVTSGQLSSQARRDALAKKYGLNIKRK